MTADADDVRGTLAPGAGPFERHVFVCTSGGTCPDQGGVEIHMALKELASARCGKVDVRVNKAGCLAQCGNGPVLVVYPENVWYAQVTLEDLDEIVDEHLVGGRPVERLLYRGHRRGPNVRD